MQDQRVSDVMKKFFFSNLCEPFNDVIANLRQRLLEGNAGHDISDKSADDPSQFHHHACQEIPFFFYRLFYDIDSYFLELTRCEANLLNARTAPYEGVLGKNSYFYLFSEFGLPEIEERQRWELSETEKEETFGINLRYRDGDYTLFTQEELLSLRFAEMVVRCSDAAVTRAAKRLHGTGQPDIFQNIVAAPKDYADRLTRASHIMMYEITTVFFGIFPFFFDEVILNSSSLTGNTDHRIDATANIRSLLPSLLTGADGVFSNYASEIGESVWGDVFIDYNT